MLLLRLVLLLRHERSNGVLGVLFPLAPLLFNPCCGLGVDNRLFMLMVPPAATGLLRL